VKISLLGFVFRRVRNSLWHLFWTHCLTAVTVAMALYVFGAFVFLETNLQRLLKGWGDEIQISAYLDKNLNSAEVQALVKRIEAYPEVERVKQTSQEQAWRDFQTALGGQSGLLAGLPRDVLPASLEVSIKPGHQDGPVVEQLARRLRQQKEFTAVDYPQEWVEGLGLVLLGVGWAKWIFGGVLFMATFFIVGSTVKLAMLARQDEIEIMQLVGASENLIQAPFLLEGMIQGVAGAIASLILLWITFQFLRGEMPSLGGFLMPLGRLTFLDLRSIGLLLVLGWLLGAAGSVFSLRRFLKSWNASRSEA